MMGPRVKPALRVSVLTIVGAPWGGVRAGGRAKVRCLGVLTLGGRCDHQSTGRRCGTEGGKGSEVGRAASDDGGDPDESPVRGVRANIAKRTRAAKRPKQPRA